MEGPGRHDRILGRDKCVLVVLDIQEKLFPSIFEGELLEKNAQRLIAAARALRVPTIVTEQYPRGIGPTMPSLVKALEGDYRPIEKTSFSCWLAPEFRTALGDLGREQVLISGMESHVCVEQTALDLCAENYQVHIVSDAVSSRTARNRDVGLDKMREHGSVITSTESAIFELLEYSGTDDFKALLPMLREMM